MRKSNQKYIDLDHARTPEQRAAMERIEKRGVCPFCPEHFLVEHTKPIINAEKWKFWILTTNFHPYKGSRYHFFILCKRHITTIPEISSEEWIEFGKIQSWIVQEYKINGGTLLMRSGDTDMTGASVGHLHAQFIVGGKKFSGNKENPIFTVIGYPIEKNP